MFALLVIMLQVAEGGSVGDGPVIASAADTMFNNL